MVTDSEKEILTQCARKFHVKSLLLFGSASESGEYRDIDVAVDGINPKLFFKFYAELFKRMKKSVDLVNLADNTAFTRLIRDTGVKIYG